MEEHEFETVEKRNPVQMQEEIRRLTDENANLKAANEALQNQLSATSRHAQRLEQAYTLAVQLISTMTFDNTNPEG